MTQQPNNPIPEATIERLPGYLRVLQELATSGSTRVSSTELAEAAHVQSALLRRDLSYLGTYGTRGVGYQVDLLIAEIGAHVGSRDEWPILILGIGNLGRALASHGLMLQRGFRIAGLVDSDPSVVGTRVAGLVVSDQADLEHLVATLHPRIAVLTTPAPAAQQLVDRLVSAGVRSLLNFAPTTLEVPAGVRVRTVDLAHELQILAYHESHRAELSQSEQHQPEPIHPSDPVDDRSEELVQ